MSLAGALVPGVCQAGSLLEPQHWSSQPNSNASLLSPSAVPARLEEQRHTAQLTTKPRRGAKRAASEPTPAAPPLGKKKKRVGKKASKSKKDKAAKPHKKASAVVSDTDLYAMLQLVAGRHGWAIGDTPEPTDTGLAQAALPPTTAGGPAATTQPGPSGTGSPARGGAFPPQAPAVPAEAFMQFEGSVTTETPNSDWSSLQGLSPTDTDIWSVTTGAPSLVEQEAAPGLKTP